jgi:hypothetical protein
MKRFLSTCLLFTLLYTLLFPTVPPIYSADTTPCPGDVTITTDQKIYASNEPINIDITISKPTLSSLLDDANYYVSINQDWAGPSTPPLTNSFKGSEANNNPVITKHFTITSGLQLAGTYTLKLVYANGPTGNANGTVCSGPGIRVDPFKGAKCTINMSSILNKDDVNHTADFTIKSPLSGSFLYKFLIHSGKTKASFYDAGTDISGVELNIGLVDSKDVSPSQSTVTFDVKNKLTPGEYTASIFAYNNSTGLFGGILGTGTGGPVVWGCAYKSFVVSRDSTSSKSGETGSGRGAGQIDNQKGEQNNCDGSNCTKPPPTCQVNGKNEGIQSSIGCIPTSLEGFINGIFTLVTLTGGGIALIMLIMASISMMTSAGNPETVKKAREQFTAAIVGILFILFSVTLLQIIGVDILQIPGLDR